MPTLENYASFINRARSVVDSHLAINYWGVNFPSGYWVNALSSEGVKAMILPLSNLEIDNAVLTFETGLSLMFKLPRTTHYDNLPINLITEILLNIAKDIKSGSFCYDEFYVDKVAMDDGITVTVENGTEAWLISAEIFILTRTPYYN